MDTKERTAYLKAGKIAANALQKGIKLIKPGVLLLDVVETIENDILKNGGGLAFPAQINKSKIAAHYCPDYQDLTEIEEGDLIKTDCGAHIEGYIADNARCIDLGTGTMLKQASEEALEAATKTITEGSTPAKCGKAIQEVAQKYGYQPIRNLSGHGIARWNIHTTPSMPNFETNTHTPLKAGQVIAIEPFITNGKGLIYEGEPATVFMQVNDKNVRSPISREVLKTIKTYNGLPFAKRWIANEFGVGKTALALRELFKYDILRSYGPLPEQAGGTVAQSENTFIVEEEGCTVTTLAQD